MSTASETEGSFYSDPASDEERKDQKNESLNSEPEKQPNPVKSASNDTSAKRKRKRDVERTRNKRMKSHYNDEYRQLYNSVITETNTCWSGSNPDRLETTQQGVSIWTATEKHKFFNALSRHGEDDMPKIVAVVKTKSEPEIRAFLLTLKEGVVEAQLNKEHHQRPGLDKIPAALEISEECCESLDLAGKALSLYQDSWDAQQEQHRFGDYWLITEDIGAQIDAALSGVKPVEYGVATDMGDGVDEAVEKGTTKDGNGMNMSTPTDAVPAAQLLKPSAWVELANRIFMNAGGSREEENWRSIAKDEEEIGIYHTAFSDFHRLAISITRRLVHMSVNQATSRLRARDKKRDERLSEPSVRRQDVLTALDILNMPANAREFWIKSPRRSGVLVHSRISGLKKEEVQHLSYEEVERRLGETPGRPAKATIVTTSSGNRSVMDHNGITLEDPSTAQNMKLNADRISEVDESDDESGEDEETLELQQDIYAEKHDQEQSRLEELNLWKLLGKSPLSAIASSSPKSSKRPTVERKQGDELKDWRDRVNFKAEWERYGEPVLKAEFEEVQQRKQRAYGIQVGHTSQGRRHSTESQNTDNESSTTGVVEEQLSEEGEDETGSNETADEDLDAEAASMDMEKENAEVIEERKLPIRRTLQPRRARDSATSSMVALPPYPELNESSGDEYQNNHNVSP